MRIINSFNVDAESASKQRNLREVFFIARLTCGFQVRAKEGGEVTINRAIDTRIFIYLRGAAWLLAHAHRKKMINLSHPRPSASQESEMRNFPIIITIAIARKPVVVIVALHFHTVSSVFLSSSWKLYGADCESQ